MTEQAAEKAQGVPCPYHSTLDNGMQLYGARHPCLTVYDTLPPEVVTPLGQGRALNGRKP